MKPIEPGCLAMIVSSKFPQELGLIVQVIKQVDGPVVAPDGYRWNSKPGSWLVGYREPMPACLGGPLSMYATYRYDGLLRIDGHEPETRQEKREVTA